MYYVTILLHEAKGNVSLGGSVKRVS